MQHQQALATKASERYLLGEMSELERFAFEAHYFDCPSCADDVRTGAALARGIKAVCAEDASLRPHTAVVQERPRRGWLSWLSPAALVPSTAAIALGCVAGWQGLVLIPSLRWASAPQALSPIALARRRAWRGAGADRPPGPTGIGALPRYQRRRPRNCPYLRSGRSGRRHHFQQANYGPACRYPPWSSSSPQRQFANPAPGLSAFANRAPRLPATPSPYNSTEETKWLNPNFTPDATSFAATPPE